MDKFEDAISSLDLCLFEKIESQSSEEDKRSLLACQLATRQIRPGYNYLEIGSHLGGSIQSHLLDPRCARIFSIDKRSDRQPDARGVSYTYLNNTTQRMMKNLEAVSSTDKITAIDGTTSEIDSSLVDVSIDLAFIDGEHTDEAVFRDFVFCMKVASSNAAITFHDATVTYNGIDRCLQYLEEHNARFRAYSLPNIVFVIEIGEFPLHTNPAVLDRLTNNYSSYIYSLQANDYYRRFSNKPPFRLYRRFTARLKGLNKFD